MNNKGFTLVELLGVLAVLMAIILVAIPSISSSLERNKNKVDEQKREIILSAAEIYVNKHKKEFEYNSFLLGKCGIPVSKIKADDLLTDDELLNSQNKKLNVKYSNGTVISDIENAMIKYYNGSFIFSPIRECQKRGDVNKDGYLTNADVELLMNASVSLIEFDAEQKAIGDMDNDGEITASDAMIAMQIINGLIEY